MLGNRTTEPSVHEPQLCAIISNVSDLDLLKLLVDPQDKTVLILCGPGTSDACAGVKGPPKY